MSGNGRGLRGSPWRVPRQLFVRNIGAKPGDPSVDVLFAFAFFSFRARQAPKDPRITSFASFAFLSKTVFAPLLVGLLHLLVRLQLVCCLLGSLYHGAVV